jgi:hypothetical protein
MPRPMAVDHPIVASADRHGQRGSPGRLLARPGRLPEGARCAVDFLGDFVDRGPDVRGTIEWVLGLGARHQVVAAVMGSHDLALVRAARLDGGAPRLTGSTADDVYFPSPPTRFPGDRYRSREGCQRAGPRTGWTGPLGRLPIRRSHPSVAELVEALREFRRRYNEQWLIGRHGHRWPSRARSDACRGSKPLETGAGCRRVGRSGLRSSRRVDPLPPRGKGHSWTIQSLGTDRRSEPGGPSPNRRWRTSGRMDPPTHPGGLPPVRSIRARLSGGSPSLTSPSSP